MKKKTLSIIFALFISCTLFVACGKEEIVEVVAPIESVETVEPIETITEEIEISVEESTETVAEIEEDFKVEDMEPTTMYALQKVNLRQGPSAEDFDKVGALKYAQSITVTGEVKEYKGEETNWLRAETEDGKEVYVAAKYLSIYKPSTQSSSGGSGSSNSGGSGNTSGGGSSSNGPSMSREDILSKIGGGGAGGGVDGQATTGGSGASTDLKLQ